MIDKLMETVPFWLRRIAQVISLAITQPLPTHHKPLPSQYLPIISHRPSS